MSVRQGHTGREVGRKSLSDKRFFSFAILVHAPWGEMLLKELEFQWLGPGLLPTANVTAIAR